MRGVRSNSVCGVAEHGADVPARRSSSVRGRGERDHRQVDSPRAVAGRNRMARLPRRSSCRGAACGSGPGPGANASSLMNEPAAGKVPLDCRTCSRVGWTSLPPTSNSAHFAANGRSGRWTRRSGSRAGRERIAVFADSFLLLEEAPPVVHQLVEQRPGHSAVPMRMVGHFLKPQLRARHERPGFLTARNHVRRPLGLALVDEPMAQLHGCARQGWTALHRA